MDNDPELEKLNAMTARIQKAEGKTDQAAGDETKPLGLANIGFEFLGAVLVCTFLGWLADRSFGTSPWCLLGMMALGFGVGMMNVWRALGNQK